MRIYAKYVLVAYLLSLASSAFAQGVGEFTAAPGTGRPTCESITNPVTNQSWCRDGNPPYALKVWNGSAWVSIVSTGTVTGSGADTEVAVWDSASSITGFPTFTRTNTDLNVSYSADQEFRVSANAIDMTGIIALGTFGGSPSSLAFFSPGGQTATFRASSSATGSWACSWPGATGAPGQVMKWHNAITPCSLEWNDPITGGTCPSGEVVSGISASGAVTCTPNASGVSGKVQICDTASTSTVNFATAASSNSYPVTLGTQASVGTPPHVVADYNNPTTAGFGIRISDIPGTGNCVDVSWSVGGVTAASASGVNGTGTPPNIAIWSGTTKLTDFAGSSCSISGQFATSISAAGTFTCASPALTNMKTKSCVVIIGDPNSASPVLVDGNDSPVACPNDTGTDWTITTVACWADAGSPTVTPILTGGASTSIVNGAITCGTASWAAGTLNGTPIIHSFSGAGATCASTPCSADVNITSAGGVARYIVLKLVGTIPYVP